MIFTSEIRIGKPLIPNILTAFIDVATKHAHKMQVSTPFLDKLGLFWVVTKNKIKLLSIPEDLPMQIQTWPITPERIKSIRFATVSQNGKVIAEIKSEWVLLKKENFSIAKTLGVYPEGLIFSDKVLLDGVWRSEIDIPNSAVKQTDYTVRPEDIDQNNHFNNISYVKAVFSSKLIDNDNIKELEIHYKRQCFLGDKLVFKLIKGETDNIYILKDNEVMAICFITH